MIKCNLYLALNTKPQCDHMNSIAAFALMVAIMIQQHVILLASQF